MDACADARPRTAAACLAAFRRWNVASPFRLEGRMGYFEALIWHSVFRRPSSNVARHSNLRFSASPVTRKPPSWRTKTPTRAPLRGSLRQPDTSRGLHKNQRRQFAHSLTISFEYAPKTRLLFVSFRALRRQVFVTRASDADRRSGRRRDAWRRSLPSVFIIFANVSAIRPSRQCGYAPSKAAKPRVGCAAFRGRASEPPTPTAIFQDVRRGRRGRRARRSSRRQCDERACLRTRRRREPRRAG